MGRFLLPVGLVFALDGIPANAADAPLADAVQAVPMERLGDSTGRLGEVEPLMGL